MKRTSGLGIPASENLHITGLPRCNKYPKEFSPRPDPVLTHLEPR
jgi:hypothetical protein